MTLSRRRFAAALAASPIAAAQQPPAPEPRRGTAPEILSTDRFPSHETTFVPKFGPSHDRVPGGLGSDGPTRDDRRPERPAGQARARHRDPRLPRRRSRSVVLDQQMNVNLIPINRVFKKRYSLLEGFVKKINLYLFLTIG